MRSVVSGLAWPSRLLMVTMSTCASISCEAWVWRNAWKVTAGWPMLSAKCAHAADTALGDSGPPSAPANSKASSANAHQHRRQGDVAAPGFGLRPLAAQPVRFGLFHRLAHLNELAIEIDPVPAQRQHLAQPHAGEQRHQRHHPVAPAAELAD